jgi:hypothetical protein
MTDWFQTLMSGFARAVQSAGANQRQQEQQAQEASSSGESMFGLAGVAAALGNVAANASSTNTEQLRPETIGGRFNDEVRDTAFIVLTPVGAGFVARLVPGIVYALVNGQSVVVGWTQPSYSPNVPLIYWTGTTYAFVPTMLNIPSSATQVQQQQIAAMNQIGLVCRALFRTGPAANPITVNLFNNAATSGHYYVDLVFALVGGTWQQTPTPTPVVRQPVLGFGRRLNRTSSLGNIYHEYDTAMKVNVQWPMIGIALQNSWVAPATVINGAMVAFQPEPKHAGMLLQPNFVAGLFEDRNLLSPELLAFPGYARAASALFTAPNGVPLHLDYDGLVPAGTVQNPLVLVNRIAVPAAVAVTPAQPSTLIISRILRPINGPWLGGAFDGTFPIGGGTLAPTLTPTLLPTTVFANAGQPSTPPIAGQTTLTANSDHYLGVTNAGALTPIVVQPIGALAPMPPQGVVWISMTTTNATGVTASVQLLPNVIPGSTAPWIESFAIPLAALQPGEMNRVIVAITQPAIGQWSVQVTLNEVAAGAVMITPTQTQIA